MSVAKNYKLHGTFIKMGGITQPPSFDSSDDNDNIDDVNNKLRLFKNIDISIHDFFLILAGLLGGNAFGGIFTDLTPIFNGKSNLYVPWGLENYQNDTSKFFYAESLSNMRYFSFLTALILFIFYVLLAYLYVSLTPKNCFSRLSTGKVFAVIIISVDCIYLVVYTVDLSKANWKGMSFYYVLITRLIIDVFIYTVNSWIYNLEISPRALFKVMDSRNDFHRQHSSSSLSSQDSYKRKTQNKISI